jgi:hypothetical protein
VSAKTGNIAPTAKDGAQGIGDGSNVTRSIAARAGDYNNNIVSYKLISTGFSRTTFKFTWYSSTGSFKITPPEGEGGASYIKWQAIDGCGAVSRTATETLDFVDN